MHPGFGDIEAFEFLLRRYPHSRGRIKELKKTAKLPFCPHLPFPAAAATTVVAMILLYLSALIVQSKLRAREIIGPKSFFFIEEVLGE